MWLAAAPRSSGFASRLKSKCGRELFGRLISRLFDNVAYGVRLALSRFRRKGPRMFYEPHKKNHGLPHDPFKAIVAPRPIGWITTMSSKSEVNLAPYSFFNGLSAEPPLVMFCSEGRKDSVVFV